MENTKTATPVIVISSQPSEKLVDYLIRDSLNQKGAPEEIYKRLIVTVWEKASTPRKKRPIEDVVIEYINNNELLQRLNYTREVMGNTLAKMTHGVPSELSWGYSKADLSIVGVFRKASWGNRWDNISAQINEGTKKFEPEDRLKFTYSYTSYNRAGNTQVQATEYIEFSLLRNDPMAISQMVRKACREFALQKQEEDIKQFEDEITELQKKSEELNDYLEKARNRRIIKPARKPRPAKPELKEVAVA